MDLLQALGTLMSFTAFGLVGAGVMKAFHISNDLSEIKELLRDIRRNGEDPSRRVPPAVADNRDALLRQMNEDEYAAAIHAKAVQEASAGPLFHAVNSESALDGEVIPPQR